MKIQELRTQYKYISERFPPLYKEEWLLAKQKYEKIDPKLTPAKWVQLITKYHEEAWIKHHFDNCYDNADHPLVLKDFKESEYVDLYKYYKSLIPNWDEKLNYSEKMSLLSTYWGFLSLVKAKHDSTES